MKKVAILIPTKNRIDFVIRMIKYYVSINSPHPIFIADASSDSSEELVDGCLDLMGPIQLESKTREEIIAHIKIDETNSNKE